MLKCKWYKYECERHEWKVKEYEYESDGQAGKGGDLSCWRSNVADDLGRGADPKWLQYHSAVQYSTMHCNIGVQYFTVQCNIEVQVAVASGN